jgi:hypothetical protein
MMNYSGIAHSPFLMSAPNPVFQIAALKFDNSLLEVTWQDNHCSRYPGIVADMAVPLAARTGGFETPHSQLPRRPG